MNQTNSLTSGPILRPLVRFSLPFLLSYILQGLYTNVDMIVIGHFCDAAALSGVTTGGSLMQVITSLLIGLGDGVTVVIGQFFGAKQRKSITESIGTSFVVMAAFSCGLLVLLELLAAPILSVMQVPDAAWNGAMNYTRICYAGLIFIGGYNVTTGVLRGTGDSRRPLIFVAVSCVTNIILDLVLVGLFGMGITGAALATTLAQGASFIISALYLRGQESFAFDFRPSSFRPCRDKAAALLSFGTPIMVQNVLSSASFLIMFAIFNRMGVAESATAGVGDKLAVIAQYPAMAFSAAIAAFAAQNVGAQQMKRAGTGCRIVVTLSMSIGLLLNLMLVIFPAQLMRIYTTDAEVIALGWQYLYPFAAEGFLVSFVFCVGGFLNGCGHSRVSMAAHLISTFAVRVPLLLILWNVPGASLLQVAAASPISSFVQLLILSGYLLTGKWRIPRNLAQREG